MQSVLAVSLLVLSLLTNSAIAQSAAGGFPSVVLTAKTIAVVNDTQSGPVADGAVSALKAWGQFTLVDDPESADVTLSFDKSSQHEGQTTEKEDPAGNTTDRNYSLSFSSQIRMRAYYKGAATPFYTTKTGDSKAKAGISCVNDLRSAYRVARQQHP